jgi:hypothetical protein
MPGKGIFFSISDEENAAFHIAIEHYLGRKIKRGDLTRAGSEAMQLWIAQHSP